MHWILIKDSFHKNMYVIRKKYEEALGEQENLIGLVVP